MTRMRAVGGALVLGLLLFAATDAHAAPILIQGDAKACFGDCTTLADFQDSTSASIGGATLSYISGLSDFWGWTEDDVLAIDDTHGSFGTLSVSTAVKQAVNTTFALLLTFVNPDSPAAVFEAAIRGTISTSLTTGGLHVSFDPSVVTVPFNDPATGQSGNMTIYADNLSLARSGSSAALTGFIVTEPVPEPGTLILLGSGMLGLVARRRKLRKEV